MTSSRLMNLRICDDVRDGPRGPLLGRTLYNSDPEDTFFIAVPFSETQPQAFSTRWDARDYVKRRGKPVTDSNPQDAGEATDEGARTA